MKTKNRSWLYIFLIVLIAGIAYTACKDITPAQEHIQSDVDIKLNK